MSHPAPASLPETCDVAIVGCGPVGATLAGLLGLRGLNVLVLDREAGVYRLPRAIHFDGECMRVFQTLGIADELLPTLAVASDIRFVDAAQRLLMTWHRPATIGVQGWHPGYRFHQPTLELALRQRLRSMPHVDLRLHHEVFAIDACGDAASLRIEDMDSGRLRRVRARYVVGCDGARSTVRRFMGAALEDLRSHERWLVVDVVLTRERPDLGDYSVQHCDPARPSTYVRGPGMRRRWELMLLPHEDAAGMMRPDNVWRLLSPWITPSDATLERPAVYTFHSVIAEGWRRGQLLIAGDAAHQTPPFMGQGMCAGIRDAANLAWKLADVLSGQAYSALLDSYESERSPHVREFINAAVRLGSLIQVTDPEAARQRDAQMLRQPEIFAAPQPRLGPGMHDDSPAAGRIGEQTLLADGTRQDDAVGYHAALLVTPALAEDARRLAASLTVVPALSAAAQEWLARLNACAVLLRPDRYVAGVASRSEDLARLLAWWRSHNRP